MQELELDHKDLTANMVTSIEESVVPRKVATPISKKCTSCRHCVRDGIFEHNGFDPVNKTEIWKKGHRLICTKKLSLEAQNNKGVWYVCDEKNMHKCHFYEPE